MSSTVRRDARVRFLYALPFLVLAVPALAQGTQAQREACTADVMRLCGAEVPDVPRIVACLRRDRAQVSPGCQQAMREGEPAEASRETLASREPQTRRAIR